MKEYSFYNVFFLITLVYCEITYDEKLTAISAADRRKSQDNSIILLLVGLLILTVLTIWLFKLKRFRFFHETGVCMVYGKLSNPTSVLSFLCEIYLRLKHTHNFMNFCSKDLRKVLI